MKTLSKLAFVVAAALSLAFFAACSSDGDGGSGSTDIVAGHTYKATSGSVEDEPMPSDVTFVIIFNKDGSWICSGFPLPSSGTYKVDSSQTKVSVTGTLNGAQCTMTGKISNSGKNIYFTGTLTGSDGEKGTLVAEFELLG
ncbi:MAG: hypothetical protein J1D88_04375 [Treponema sp.]|nr:hypothetical protein [Treponema sp.]